MEPPMDKHTPPNAYNVFRVNLARLPLIARHVYNTIFVENSDTLQMGAELPPEFFDYYVTALLWARLLHIKRHYSYLLPNAKEEEYWHHFFGSNLNVPEPIYFFLTMIGSTTHPLHGYEMFLHSHELPVSVSGTKGGYHSTKITSESLLPFIEVPSLGVSGDCVMCLVSATFPYSVKYGVTPIFPFLPIGTNATRNMA